MDLEAYAQYIAQARKVVYIDGVPWHDENRRVLTPLAPPNVRRPVSRDAVRKAMREIGALLANWTDAWDTAPCAYWYVACDDKNYDLDKLTSDCRANVRKCAKNLEVRRLENEEAQQQAYSVYAAATKSYGAGFAPASEEAFIRGYARQNQYVGTENWGALLNGKLIAYTCCLLVGNTVYISASKSDPEHLKLKPNNGVQFALTQEYLVKRGFSVVISGGRCLSHDTNIQDFNLRMGFRRIYCPMRVELGTRAKIAMATQAHRWGSSVGLGKFAPGALEKLKATARLVQIARQCETPGSYDPDAQDAASPKADVHDE